MTDESLDEGPTFRWVKVTHGWISFALDGGSRRYRSTVSDGNDVVSELLHVVARIVLGSAEECVSFDHEPVEIRWTLRRSGAEVFVSVESFETWGSEVGGKMRWRGAWATPQLFGQEFLRATESFLERIGRSGYEIGWPSYPIPDDAIGELRASLADHAS